MKGLNIISHLSTIPTSFVVCYIYLIFVTAEVVAQHVPRGNQNPTRKRTDFLELLLGDQNDIKSPPNYDSNDPVYIDCELLIDSVDAISEVSMDFTLSVSIHLRWVDHRLGRQLRDIEYLEFDAHNMENLWVPDIFFPNEKKASFHNVMMENRMLRLYQTGIVSYSTRLSLILSCPMNLRSYPFDKQVCSVKIESFGYTEHHLVLRWANDSEPVVIEERNLPQFEVQGHTIENYTESHRIRGNHSCLRADFHLARNIGHYIIQMYIPSFLIVMLSWVSFWLNVGSVPGRVSLGVLSVLTISTQSSSVNAALPQVSYTKAIDIWMATCLVFVFAALIEFAIANALNRCTAGRSIVKQMFTIPDNLREQNENVSKNQNQRDSVVNKDGQVQLQSPLPDKTGYIYAMYLDLASRVFFPAMFVAFNVVYWVYYLNLNLS
ncbi:hypothetical protein ScPMuIL_010874 [Solemya velum]